MLTKKISDLLTPRLSIIRSIVDKAVQYLDIIKNIIASINPDQHREVQSNIKSLGESIDSIATLKWDVSHDKILTTAASLYQDFITIDGQIQQLISVVEDERYSKLIVYNMSSTYTTNLYQMRNSILQLHEKYLENVLVTDESIFSLIFALPFAADELFSFIIGHDRLINKFTIKMISNAISSTSPEKRRRLELIVEKQKDLVLGAGRIDLSAEVGIQGMLVRYNLRPTTKSLTLDKLFTIVNAEYNPAATRDENFAALSQSGVGVIAVNKSTPSPVEFDLSGLIDDNYITVNDLKTNPISGLTKKIIDRFSTAVLLPRGGPAQRVMRYGRGEKWWIFESINGDLWRIMGVNADVGPVAASDVEGLLSGVTTRPHQYNGSQESIILSKCFNPLSQLMLAEYEDMKVSLPSSEPIRAAILDRLSQTFESKISVDMPNSAASVRHSAIDKYIINETLLDILTHSTGAHGKGSAEYLVTYMMKFDGIIYDFTKKLERQWSAINMPERIFKELRHEELKSELMTIFKGVTRAAIVDLDQTNTWTDYDMSLKEFVLEREQIIV